MIAAKYRLFSAEPKLVSSRDNWKSTLEAIRAVIAPTYSASPRFSLNDSVYAESKIVLDLQGIVMPDVL